MTIKLQFFLIIIFTVVLVLLLWQVRSRKLELRYTLSWLLLDVVLLILSVFPSLLVVMSSAMGIYVPVNMIFFCGFAFSLFIIYTLTVAISKMADEIRRLAQRVALLEKQLAKEAVQPGAGNRAGGTGDGTAGAANGAAGKGDRVADKGQE